MKKVNVNCLIMFLRFINIFIELCFLVGVLTIDFIVFLATNLPSLKCLADLCEAVAGAIYFDSGRSLDQVRNSYIPML